MTFETFVPTEVEAALGHRYRIDYKIAAGGQGTVFRATRNSLPDGTATNDLVALKLHFDPKQAVRVQREVTALETLSHPNLERLIEHGHCYVSDRKTRYIAYEYIEGHTLKQRLKIGGRLLESEVLPIARDVSAAVAALWSQRIVHGDIKPSNIVLRESGEAVLIDLGVLRVHRETVGRPLTPVGFFSPELVRGWGTPGYLSPEQVKGETLTCASDIFSLGVVILECLHGWHPTKGDQAGLLNGMRATGRGLDVSPGLLSVLDKMLLVTPKSRGNVTKLASYFQVLLQRINDQFTSGVRVV
jgi:eukaryotic-like serine/threonine-protein kinase